MANGVNFRRRVDHFLPSLALHSPEKYQPSTLFSFSRQDPEFPALLGQETGSGGGARHFRSEPRGRTTRHPVSTVWLIDWNYYNVANSLQHFPARMENKFSTQIKMQPLVKLASLEQFYKKHDYIFENIPVPKSVKFQVFQAFMRQKYRTQNVLRIRPLFFPFWENMAKIRPQICPATYCTFLLGLFWVGNTGNWLRWDLHPPPCIPDVFTV